MSTIYYHTEYKSYSRFAGPGRVPVKAHFIETKCTGDWNITHYSNKIKTSTRDESREQVYFIPREDAKESDIQCELKRGNTFFSRKDGFLFGARVELLKLGQLVYTN